MRGTSGAGGSAASLAAMAGEDPLFVRAIYDYDGSGTGSLSFQRGEIIEVLTKLESGWWDGVRLSNDERGWFPSNYVAAISESEAQMARDQIEADEMQRRQDALAQKRASRQLAYGRPRQQPVASTSGGLKRTESQLESELWASINSLGHANQIASLSDMSAHDMFAEMAAHATLEPSTDEEYSSQGGSVNGDEPTALSVPVTASNSRDTMDPTTTGTRDSSAAYWGPRVTEDGQIFYVNSLTGATSRDMPADLYNDAAVVTGLDREQLTATPLRNGAATQYHAASSTSSLASDVPDPQATVRRTNGATTSTVRDAARFSTYSSDGDSALDAQPRGLPRGPRAFGSGSTPSQRQPNTVPPVLEQLQPPALETLAALEARVIEAFNALIDEANPRNEKDQIAEPAVIESERERLYAVAHQAAIETRTLFQETDTTFEPALTNTTAAHGQPRWPFSLPPEASSSSFQALIATRRPSIATASTVSMNQAELRPYTRKISSVMSKMLLSVRAVWGLMSVSAAEEAAKERSLAEVDSEDEAEALRHDRAEVVKYRRTIENRLRWDIVDGARAVIEGVNQFIEELERLASDAGLGADRTRLYVARRQRGHLEASPAELLTPAAGHAGNWRGNGFATSAPSDLPKTFSRDALVLLNATRKQLAEEASELRAVLNTAIARAAKRASSMSTASQQSGLSASHSRPATPAAVAAAQVQAGATPAQSAARHYSKVCSHVGPVLRALGAYLGSLDDINIAARVEIGTAAMPTDNGKGKGRADDQNSEMTAMRSDRTAVALLSTYESAKQSLYDVSPSLVLHFQSIATSSLVDSMPSAALQVIADPCQPQTASPLAGFVVPPKPVDPVAALLQTLVTMDRALNTLSETLDALLNVADQQASESRRARPNLSALQTGHRFSTSASSGITTSTAHGGNGGAPSTRSTESGSFASNGALATPDSLVFPAHARPGTSSTSQSIGGPDTFASPVSSSTAWDHPHYRDSYTESLGGVSSTRQSAGFAESVGMQPTISDISSSSSSIGVPANQRSPSRSKKLEKFFGVGPPASVAGAPALPQETPSFLRADYDYRDLSYNMEGQIKGGTLRALVARLTSHESVDHTYISNFLMTFRTFMSAEALLDLLIGRYFIEPPVGISIEDMQTWIDRKQKIIQIRTVNILKIWIETHLWEGDADVVFARVLDFAASVGGPQAAQLNKVIDVRRRNGPRRMTGSAVSSTSPPSSIVPKKQKFLDMDSLEVARQLSLMDSRLCSRITAAECLSKAWPKAIRTETPNITAMISNGNSIIHWVIDTILTQSDIRKRAATIKHFVHIAENFSTLMSIIAGLSSTPVHRLRRTWDTINARTLTALQSLTDLMSANRNFAAYREAIRSVGPPCVPFIGVFLTSWTFIGDGNADFLREKPDQINMQKRSKAAELISQIQLYQLTPYNLNDVPIIRHWIEDHLKIAAAKDEQQFYAMSLQLEPRERDDEKIARLLAESGFL